MNKSLSQLASKHRAATLDKLNTCYRHTTNALSKLVWRVLDNSRYQWWNEAAYLPKPLAYLRDIVEAFKAKAVEVNQWSELYAHAIQHSTTPQQQDYYNAMLYALTDGIRQQQQAMNLLLNHLIQQPQA